MSPIEGVEPRLLEIGRLRMGTVEDGHPSKLEHWRLTSSHLDALSAASKIYGGVVGEWQGGYELLTTSDVLNVMVPPNALTQYLEAWTAGGIQRRCDGQTELISGDPCHCDGEAIRTCDPSTLLRVLLPELPGLGVWILGTKGWTAAAELQGSVALLARLPRTGEWPVAELALEQRTKVVEGQTRRYVVPAIRLPYTLAEALGPRGLGPGEPPTYPPLVVGTATGESLDLSTGEITSPVLGAGAPSGASVGTGGTSAASEPEPATDTSAPTGGAPVLEEPAAPAGPSPPKQKSSRPPGKRPAGRRWDVKADICPHVKGLVKSTEGDEVCSACGTPAHEFLGASA